LGQEATGARAVRELLESRGIRVSKSMGQNFLVDANIPLKMVRLSGIDSACGALEIGPGLGALTSALSEAAGQVVSVELDSRLVPVLRDMFGGKPNVEIVHGDALKLDVGGLATGKMPGLRHVACANLPYSITTPAITALIGSGVFESITVMIQREVAQRVCARPASPEYGAFTVFVNYHTEPEALFDVPPDCFVPRPGVHSTVVILRARAERLLAREDEALFFRVVRAAFGQRRKTLANALHAAFGGVLEKGCIAEAIEQCGFDPRARGETLGTAEFARLSSRIKAKIGN